MLTTESDAKLRFCPFGRGAFMDAHTSKFMTGINQKPGAPLTLCMGTQCMLFHVVGEDRRVDKKKKCPVCQGVSPAKDNCKACEASGDLHHVEPVGFCGGGVDISVSLQFQGLRETLDKMLKAFEISR